ETRATPWILLLRQFKSPIILILIGAAILSLFLQDPTNAGIILAIVLVSGLLGFWQEHGAVNAVSKLRATVKARARVLRDGAEILAAVEEIVPGDVVLVSAGSIIPADCRLLEARDLFISEAALTGETYPVETAPGVVPADTPLARRTNAAYMGMNVISGTGKAIAVHTGGETEFGKVFDSLRLRPPETEFERGIRHFGYLLAEVTLLLVIAIFAFNVFFQRPVLDSFLFALALAVGLTPQLLPAIISINLSHGARRMAEKKVIVKRLAVIENFGSMNVLCSDKTGTITEGVVQVHAALDTLGRDSPKTLLYAWLNAANETGLVNPIDEAIRKCTVPGAPGWSRLDEVPYDFVRKRLSILLEKDGRRVLVTKGALRQILEACTEAEMDGGSLTGIEAARPEIERHWREMSDQGRRVLGVAWRDMGSQTRITREDERGMVFLGFVVLSDPPKAGVAKTIGELNALGVQLKIITGDNALIAAHVAREIGLKDARILTGPDLARMSGQALMHRASRVDIFAEVEPSQKEQIIQALKKAGHVVGYMGDGINDASALHCADVSLSVESAVDVAREAADFVLLEHDLEVLVDGVREGRRTFANTLKYVFIATSANFGNMFSMAGASLFLPFLPLLPAQILLINLLTDFPEMTIAGDNVDPELVELPRRWDVAFIRRFMIVFGLVSSVFDFLTFVVLFHLGATMEQFRTGWFIESIVSAALIVLVIRSRRPLFASRPSGLLAIATAAIVCVALLTPHLPFAGALGFQPMPAAFYPIIALIVLLYVATAEVAKRWFYRRTRNGGNAPLTPSPGRGGARFGANEPGPGGRSPS
ncbi:MAG: magnesium-translocating P-type ATPase, partial [Terrimicrobiaceae bacterium]|nr:magnesium-translocating P-type ATPase [Terrimicrobiaceae bacterium]